MGTWDTGPFSNDSAADFAGDLDEMTEGERPAAIRAALAAVAAGHGNAPAAGATRRSDPEAWRLDGEETAYLDADDAASAVAAAALVASQCPDGPRIDSPYGPEQPVPPLPADLRPLAVAALDRVVAEDSELRELWEEGEAARRWHREIAHLREILAQAPAAAPD